MAIRYDCNRLPLRMNIILFHLRERLDPKNIKIERRTKQKRAIKSDSKFWMMKPPIPREQTRRKSIP